MKSKWGLAVTLLLIFAVCGCNSNNNGTNLDGDTEQAELDTEIEIETTEAEEETAEDGDIETAELDTENATEEEAEAEIDTTPNTFSCESAGYPIREFVDTDENTDLYALAADFTINTSAGPWNLKENWTGCESYLFIQNSPQQTQGWTPYLWQRDLADFLDLLPDNTHVFFVTGATSSTGYDTMMGWLNEQYDNYKAGLSDDELNRLHHKVHFVTDFAKDLDNYLGDLFVNPKWGFAIDRFQRIRYIGSYADYNRYDSAKQWFGPNLKMAANEGIYYNFEAERETRLSSQNATVVSIFDKEELSDPGWAGTRGYAEVSLPDADTMATFDSAELDLGLGCIGDGEYGTCPAWDYIVHLYLCDEDNTESCDTEFGRWITTYHREGRWVHDITPLLPLIKSGGTRRFAFYTQQPYEVDLKIRLINAGKSDHPVETHYLFGGGGFNMEYNDKYSPVSIDIPADASKVELATVITGHGMSSPGNCAEFCNTTHEFSFGDNKVIVDFPQASKSQDCMDQVSEGTVPNQYGTWWYGRSGWCPGKEVLVDRFDITSKVTSGETVELLYQGYYNGAPYSGGGANIVMTSWLTIYKAK